MTATAPANDAPAPPRAPAARSALRSLASLREAPVLVALALLVLATWALNPRFLTPQGIKDLFLNATIAMLMAAGQSLIIQSEGVDLSVLAGTALGAALGAVNGLLVTRARVPAMVITLGTLYVFRGALNWWAGSTQYFAGDRPQAFGDLGVATVMGFPLLTLLAVAVIAAISLFQRYARSGRDLYAIGSDRAAAAVYGIPVGNRVLMAFIVNGAMVGLGGVLYASRFNSVGATTGSGMELDIVAACVVGGVAMTGGVGTAYGAAIGALLLNTMTSALTAIGVDKFWQRAVVGALILVAIVIDRVSTVRRRESLRKEGGASA